MTRTEVIKTITSFLSESDVALFTTGMISREAFSIGDRAGNFYMLGSMGLLSAFALGVALTEPRRRVVIVEGDGSALMSLGNLPLIGFLKPKNLFHIVIDNEAYESTGGQPTVTNLIDLAQIASASSYSLVKRIKSLGKLVSELPVLLESEGPAFLLVKVKLLEKSEPPRVSLSPEEIKERLTRFLKRGV